VEPRKEEPVQPGSNNSTVQPGSNNSTNNSTIIIAFVAVPVAVLLCLFSVITMYRRMRRVKLPNKVADGPSLQDFENREQSPDTEEESQPNGVRWSAGTPSYTTSGEAERSFEQSTQIITQISTAQSEEDARGLTEMTRKDPELTLEDL
jgi:hypothetical protein